MSLSPFHLAMPVYDLKAAREFYREVLGCEEGRSSEHWVDFNFFGHQFVIHEHPQTDVQKQAKTNQVDGKNVPVPHFGVVLPMANWKVLAERLTAKNTAFVIVPYIRFEGEVGEQATMFFNDPCNNAIEIKGFNDMEQLFAK